MDDPEYPKLGAMHRYRNRMAMHYGQLAMTIAFSSITFMCRYSYSDLLMWCGSRKFNAWYLSHVEPRYDDDGGVMVLAC